MRCLKICVLFLILTSYQKMWGQQHPIFGFQLKPIFPSELFNTTNEVYKNGKNQYTTTPTTGLNFGMVMRQSLYKRISLETGISYSKRNYTMGLLDSNGRKYSTSFRYLSYEIPISAMIYIPLDKQNFINNSFGLSADFFPSNIFSQSDSFKQYTVRKFWVLPALVATTGYEFRSEKYGYFSAGISYHRMLSIMAFTKFIFTQPTGDETLIRPLSGHYFAFDFKYYIPYRQRQAPTEYLPNME
ncbi:MAG: hypothetical protein NTX03_08910 [Bacteroidetes bacterium]|nr:hypothetical protein [Bacteroidota bacterium]